MIESHVARYFELNEQAIHELVLLMSIYDFADPVPAKDILENVQERRYFRQNFSRLTFDLEFFLPEAGYLERTERDYCLTKKGRIRLRDLCELAHAYPSTVTQLNKEGFVRIKKHRQALGMYPFTNGRLTKDGPLDREIPDHCVYAALLSETALQLRYRTKNPNHNVNMPGIYVGMSQYSPRERFDNHRFGHKKYSSKYVRSSGLCLVPLIYSHLNKQKMSRQDALNAEKELAECLRQYGFAAFAGHHDIDSSRVHRHTAITS